jgi:hypothetical protein
MARKRFRRVKSISDELLHKSREGALAAVQIFNNPQITFKSELFIVTMCIAWTYMLHAYYRKQGIEYRYFKMRGKRREFDKTKNGAFKHWELERCLDSRLSPVENIVSKNLKFLIGLRHEIEHQMTTRIDDHLSARYQACCINYNEYIKKLFGDKFGIDRYLSISLQFSSFSDRQVDFLSLLSGLPKNIERFVAGFDGEIPENDYNSSKYAYRVFFIAKTANSKGQADQVVEFIRPESEISEEVNKIHVMTKEVEKEKFSASQIVKMMRSKGYEKFNMRHHTILWQIEDGKNPAKGYGTMVTSTWFWYKKWVEFVEKHCIDNSSLYT